MIKSLILFIYLISFLATFVNAAEWLVKVGAAVGQNVYQPASFDANVGDNVIFNFIDGNHDVIQSDNFGECVQSKANPFTTPKNVGNAAAPPQATFPLTKVGPFFYFCDVENHCLVGKMYGKINVLNTGVNLTVPGVSANPIAPGNGPPAQPSAPADDNPNIPPQTSSSSPSASSTSPSSSPSLTTPPTLSGANTNKQISIAVVGGSLLSLVSYFMVLSL